MTWEKVPKPALQELVATKMAEAVEANGTARYTLEPGCVVVVDGHGMPMWFTAPDTVTLEEIPESFKK